MEVWIIVIRGYTKLWNEIQDIKIWWIELTVSDMNWVDQYIHAK